MTPRARVLGTLVLAALLGLSGLPTPVAAQKVQILGGDVVLDPPTSADFLAGYSVSGTMRVRVNANKQDAWRLEVRATAADMGGAGKPVSDVFWREEASGTWVPLTMSNVQVLQGQGKAFITVYFRVRLQWGTDTAGSYSAPLEFSLSLV